MFLWSNISPNHISVLFNEVTKNWINTSLVIDVYGDVLNNSARIEKITRDFAVSSDGILKGCIGSIDGWLVCILAPTLHEVRNPGKYYARKRFYALNVQVLCDKQKRVIWRSIGQLGSIHDSRAFQITQLATYLKSCFTSLMECGLYFMGDSAYALRPYLMTPYDNAMPNSKEDTYNYFLSRNRIYIECVFGEVARRWGIFWKPLQGSLGRHVNTIDAGLKLHNYIVNYRLSHQPQDNEHDHPSLMKSLNLI